jgi:hypothetical protein
MTAGRGAEVELALRTLGAEEGDLVLAVVVEVDEVAFPPDRRAARDASARRTAVELVTLSPPERNTSANGMTGHTPDTVVAAASR